MKIINYKEKVRKFVIKDIFLYSNFSLVFFVFYFLYINIYTKKLEIILLKEIINIHKLLIKVKY